MGNNKQPGDSDQTRKRYAIRRVLRLRNLAWAAGSIAAVVILLGLIIFLLFRTGQVDKLIAGSLVAALSDYGIRAEIGGSTLKFQPNGVELRDVILYDAQSGERLAEVKNLLAFIHITDLFALELRRNINLDSLEIKGLKIFINFDDQGRSNLRNLKTPRAGPDSRITFTYSSARIKLDESELNYSDVLHKLDGEANNVRAQIDVEPQYVLTSDDPFFHFDLSFSHGTFTYDGRKIENISLSARGVTTSKETHLEEVNLVSPVGQMRLSGKAEDWQRLRYNLKFETTFDLAQLGTLLQPEIGLRGDGRVSGIITGEGAKYRVDAQLDADSLAADYLRLQNLNFKVAGEGEEAKYSAEAEALVKMLNSGDFQINMIQLMGQMMGTGVDFRWLGELQAASVRRGGTMIADLILHDSIIEFSDGKLTATSKNVTSSGGEASGAKINTPHASNISASIVSGKTVINVSRAGIDSVVMSKGKISAIEASGIAAHTSGDALNLNVDKVNVAGVEASGVSIGGFDIAGAHIVIRHGTVAGRTDDIKLGDLKIATTTTNGTIQDIALSKPIFMVEPSGKYRASADLSFGGGVLGELQLGSLQSSVTMTGDQIEFNNLKANLASGTLNGSAVIALGDSSRIGSRVVATFGAIDANQILALGLGRLAPIGGKMSGDLDLNFPQYDIFKASGTVNARFNGDVGNDALGRTPVNLALGIKGAEGNFNINSARLQAGATEVNARGRFSFDDNSDLQVNLLSSNAEELQRTIILSGLAPSIEDIFDDYGIGLAGRLDANAILRGSILNPLISGRGALESLSIENNELGGFSAQIEKTPNLLRITNGRLNEIDGGGAIFSALVPLDPQIKNGVEIEARLDQLNVGNIIASLPGVTSDLRERLQSAQGNLSGEIKVTGLPAAANGSLNLMAGPGRFGTENYEQIIARATFDGASLKLNTFQVLFEAGKIVASGTLELDPNNYSPGNFEITAKGDALQLSHLRAISSIDALPEFGGRGQFTITATGKYADSTTYQLNIDGSGRDVTMNGRSIGELTLVGRTENRIFNLNLTTGIFGAPQVVNASVDFNNPRLPATLQATFKSADLTPLIKAFAPSIEYQVRGHMSGTIKAGGDLFVTEESAGGDAQNRFSIDQLTGAINLTELMFQLEDISLMADSPLIVNFSPRAINFERAKFTGSGTNLTIAGAVALNELEQSNLTIDGGVNLGVLQTISPDLFLNGTAQLSVHLTGPFDNQRLNGSATLNKAAIATIIGNERLTASAIDGRILFTSNQLQIATLTGRLGGGNFVASGGALIKNLSLDQFRFTFRGTNVTLAYPDDFNSTGDINLEIAGTAATPIVSGTANLRRVEYTRNIDLADLIDQRRTASLSTASGGTTTPIELNLRVQGTDALIIRNDLADVVGSVLLNINGDLSDPIISGRITVSRGTVKIRNDSYELTRGIIDLPERRDADPLLNFEGETEIQGYRIILGLNGPLSTPTAIARSDPALPQEDVVSLITSGNLSEGATGTTSVVQSGLGTAANLLANSIISAPAQRATDRLFGLNQFEINPLANVGHGESPTPRLTVGRQVNRNLSVTYSTNLTSVPGQVVALEYRLSNRIYLIAQYDQGSVSNLRSRNNNFSFEVRFRKRF